MRILFFTSSAVSPIDLYNIHQVVSHYKDYDFTIVSVKRKVNKVSCISRLIMGLKKFKYELKNGRNTLLKDEAVLNKKVLKTLNHGLLEEIENQEVDTINGEATVKVISNFKPDIIVQCGAGILKKQVFQLAKFGTLNVHHGLAPEIRGMKSTLWCLHYGFLDKIGVTCHLIDENLDTGLVISQHQSFPGKNESFISIQYQLILEGARLLIESIDLISSEYQTKSESVESYYFSHFDYRNYSILKASNFELTYKNETLQTKNLTKSFLVKQ